MLRFLNVCGSQDLTVLKARLDKLIAVPKEFGLDAVLPNMNDVNAANEVTWSWEFDMTLRHWEFRGQERGIGCDLEGRTACLGRTRGGHEVWVVIADKESFREEHDIHSVQQGRGSTRMDPTDYRVVMALMAYMLADSHYSDVYLTRDYPDVTTEESLRNSTDLL